MAEGSPLRVMLVDDHELVRAGMRALLTNQADMTVVAEAGSAAEVIGAAEQSEPDVVLMDISLGDGSGIDLTRELLARWPDVRVIMLTGMADDDALFASIGAGAAGYVLKATRNADMLRALRNVAAGGHTLDEALTGSVFAHLRRHKELQLDEKLASLSTQEARVLEGLAQGQTNREIAGEMYLAERTVKNYVSSILAKLGVQRRAEAAAYFSERTQTPGS